MEAYNAECICRSARGRNQRCAVRTGQPAGFSQPCRPVRRNLPRYRLKGLVCERGWGRANPSQPNGEDS
jgi:hypothetical protein